MTKYVVSGYIGFDNFGDEAIAGVLTNYLKKNGAEKITLISSNPEKTSKLYDVNSVGMLDFIKPIMESDVLISGGGSLLQDITSLKSLLYYLSIILFAKAMDKKVIIFAQGFTPFRTKIGKFLTKFTLKKCDKITVRDLKSQELLKNLGINSELISDPVFGIEISNQENHAGVGVQLRSFEGLDDKFLEVLAEKIVENFKDEEIKLFSLQDKLDLPVLEKFAKKLTEKEMNYKIYKNLSVNETIKELSKLEYLIGMRFHSNLVAAKSGVKVLGINYDIKVKTLSENIGFCSIEMNDKDLLENFEKLFSQNPCEYKIPEFNFPEI